MAATIDPTKIPNLLESINSAEVNAKLLMNKLIVNPIPHKKDNPNISTILIPSGKSHTLSLTAIYANRVMPIGLPNINPSMIPIDSGLIKLSKDKLWKLMSLLKKANSGKMKRPTK